ncbi:hypothetical protein [Staphylococcus phage SAP6]|nr:hypothetical protein RP15_gp050 [Staphylococcus phage vB_Sau-RP15]UVD42585.1 hypothetical protein [Staphylococcus phage vB_SauM-V1SA22]UXE02933.1 hypothetical protein Koombakaat1_00143 [Staphylococcus phage Koomba-kaat_1]WAW11980.1 hypothetical protein [Staphylococcus phage StAP1]WAW12195.1 hypothetical protein [Staphylococcus phage SAP6]BBI90241.1 hypothetical protein MRS_124 [Staphylococcus phage MR003]
MDDFTRLYKKVRRTFTRNKAEWDYTNTGLRTFQLKGTNVCVTLLDSIARNNTTGYKYNVMSNKVPAIPCNTHQEVIKAIEYKLKN